MLITRFLKLFVVLALLVSIQSFANSFEIGAGGTYTQLDLPSSTGTTTSLYRGPGYVIDARLRFFPFNQASKYSFDFFGKIGQNFAANVSASDTHQQDYLAGGLDISMYKFILGMQYGRNKSQIKLTSGSYVNLTYDTIGVRAGFRLLNSDNLKITLNSIYEFGIAVPTSDNNITTYQKINQLSLNLIFHLKIIGDRSSY